MATHETSQGLRAEANGRTAAVCPGQYAVHLALCLLVLSVLLGCAHTPPSPLAEATKAHLGTIGVVSAPVTPEVDYRTPGRGGKGGAAIGAAKGLGLGVLGAVGCLGVLGRCAECLAACGLAVATPYLTVRYAVDQATEGVAANTIEAAETAVKAVLAERKHQALAREALFRVATLHTNQTLVLLPDPGPSEAPRYQPLAERGIHAVLEITIQRIALRRPRGTGGSSLLSISATDLNPSLTLVVTTRRRVVRTADGAVLYDHTGEHTGRGATFPDWGAKDAQFLQEGLDQLSREIAEEIVAQVFGVAVPPATEPATPATEPDPQLPSFPSAAERPS